MGNLCNCKACRKGLGETVNKLAQSKPISEIASTLRFKNGVDISELALRDHFRYFAIIPIETTGSASTKKQPLNLNDLTLDQWGLTIDDPAKVVSFVQEKLLALAMRQMQIVAQEQADYLEGESPFPPSKEQIGNLRVLMSLADRFTSISLQSNQQQAIRIVQALGYEAEDLKSLPNYPTA